MSRVEWRLVSGAACDEQQLAKGEELVLRIEIRMTKAEGASEVLKEIRRAASKLVLDGERGVFEGQWCDSAARISIARMP